MGVGTHGQGARRVRVGGLDRLPSAARTAAAPRRLMGHVAACEHCLPTGLASVPESTAAWMISDVMLLQCNAA